MRNFSDETNERINQINEHISLIETRDGQSFTSDAYLLAAFASTKPKATVVDLGGGSAVCSLLLADHKKAAHIYSLEIQAPLHALALRNVEYNKLGDHITPICTDIRFIQKRSFSQPIDIVIANPPYFPNGTGRISPNDSKSAARFELNGGIYDFCAAASRILEPEGQFFCVIRAERLPDLFSALRSVGLEPSLMTLVCHNVGAAPSIALIKATRHQFTQLKVTRPLYLYDGREKTAETKRIYEICSFEDFLK